MMTRQNKNIPLKVVKKLLNGLIDEQTKKRGVLVSMAQELTTDINRAKNTKALDSEAALRAERTKISTECLCIDEYVSQLNAVLKELEHRSM